MSDLEGNLHRPASFLSDSLKDMVIPSYSLVLVKKLEPKHNRIRLAGMCGPAALKYWC